MRSDIFGRIASATQSINAAMTNQLEPETERELVLQLKAGFAALKADIRFERLLRAIKATIQPTANSGGQS